MKSPALLGKLSPRAFLRTYWQKRPLFVPNALYGFDGVIEKGALAALAMRDDVESRVVERRGGRWDTAHGPFRKVQLPKKNSTLLVSGVNLHVPAADRLLRRFCFIPQARLDDVMVSYATPGGGVGPHVDSYDVFLLQGAGRRKWVFGGRKIVAHPGDLLYLPPGLQHDGVALEDCYTYSIGFRAPRGAELGAAFLDWLHERGLPDAAYRDPDLAPVVHSACIPPGMLAFAEKLLSRIRWSRSDVAEFLGRYLSSPKPHVVFRRSRTQGKQVRLDPRTQLLYTGNRFFLNGESVGVPKKAVPGLKALADRRHSDLRRLAPLAGLIAQWRRAGYLHLTRKAPDDG
jgi:50S ribosomal protein L16 3-hydroxylase